jgi:hypothetical protein
MNVSYEYGNGLEKQMSIGVHEAHCCKKHGCKYGEADCPVVLGTHKQRYACEQCEYEAMELVEQARLLANDPEAFLALLDAVLKNAPEIDFKVLNAAQEARYIMRRP